MIVLIVHCNNAKADLIIQFGGSTIGGSTTVGPFSAGTTGVVVPVLAYDDGLNVPGPIALDNATITVELGELLGSGPTGNDIAPFTNFSVTAGSLTSVGFTPAVSPALLYDFNVTGTGTSFNVSTSAAAPDTLFNLMFDIAPGTADGIYNVRQNGPGVLNTFSNATIPIAQAVSFTDGGVQVQAVPEPTSMALLSVAGITGGVVRYRRRKREQAEQAAV